MNEQTFEQSLAKLEQIIQNMDSNVSLEESMKNYKQGMELIKTCQEKLNQVEQQIKILDVENDQLKDFSNE